MSTTPDNTPAPRRSQREKKLTKQFISTSNSATSRKRKRPDTDSENDLPPLTESDDGEAPADDEDGDEEEEEEEYRAPKPKTNIAEKKGATKSVPKTKSSSVKKARIAKAQGPKQPKLTTRRPRKPKQGDNAYDAAQVARDTKILLDNPLFNAFINPTVALQSAAEDFLESLDQTPGAAQAELINMVLRSCGCNDSVNADEAVDYDGVVDALDNFTENLKQENSPVYPLTSKLPMFKKLRKVLSEFIERLIVSSADLGLLYSSDLMATLQTWVIAMSSSQIRSFRHTATVIALEVESALCGVAAAVEKDAEVVGRQREGEKKRKGTNKGGNARLRELESKAKEIRERRTKLAEFLKEFVDGVFVHRYRDLDANIRAECVRALGVWFRKYPGHFLDPSYLRYVGWVLSDSDTHVRLEAVKALSGVYDQSDYIGSLSHFTERFKPRLLEMARGDTELSVRVAVIQVLSAIDSHSLLEDDEKEKLCLLAFDEEIRVRRTVSQFVRGVWEESVEERLAGRKSLSSKDKDRVGIKVFAMLLVKWGALLDNLVGDADNSDNGDNTNEAGETSSRPPTRRKEMMTIIEFKQGGRNASVVEALWDELEPVKDWEGLLEILSLDHSASGSNGESSSPRARANGKDVGRTNVDEIWRLDEVEETILLEILSAALRRAKIEAVGGKKGEEENISNDITRALIKDLPRLFKKYQTDQNRIAIVLLIPTLMNLDLYLEMRMITSYASLWDDVIKQFLSSSSPSVLAHAIAAIQHLMDATSLSNTNSTKILELEDELSSSLRDAIAGREEIEVASFLEDEVLALSALCSRLAILTGVRNMINWMEEDEGGKQSSAWDIISALVERGRLGYKEEELMVEQALHVLTLHILWKCRGLSSAQDLSPEELKFKETLREQRDSVLEKLVEYAVGTQSNTVNGVKRAAFKHLLDLHVLFSAAQTFAADGSTLPIASLSLTMVDEVQYRCAGFIQAEIERYAEDLYEEPSEDDHMSDKSSRHEDSSDEEGAEAKQRKERRVKRRLKTVHPLSRARLEQEYLFIDLVSTFLRAIRSGAIHIQHGSVILAHYGRLGVAFDACSKIIVDVLRVEGMMKDNAEVVVTVLTDSLREAYTLVLDGIVEDETSSLKLSKLLSTCFVIRGSQLSIMKRLDAQHIVQIHINLLTWISKRLSTYINNKNKRSLKGAIVFFKVLALLLGMVQTADALKIKAHLDQVLAQAKIEVPPASKTWDALRAYEKKLTVAMTKEGGGKGRKGDKSAAGVTDEEESELERLGEEPPQAKPRPRPRRPTRANPAPERESEGPEEELSERDPERELEVAPTTPKARPRPKPVFSKPSPEQPINESPMRSPEPSGNASEPGNDGIEEDTMTPKVSRKRTREDDGSESEVAAHQESGDPIQDPQLTPPSDMQVRRKRVRH